MKLLKDFFEKFNTHLNEKKQIDDSIIDIIFKATNINLTKEQFKIRNKTIYLHCSSIKRSEVMMHKELILSEIPRTLPNMKIIDIK